jgi:uroporphyrinogen decarboxylase
MTARERVLTALNHQQPDRPPLNYFGTSETTDRLLKRLSLDTYEDLLSYFGADMRYVSPRYVGPDSFSGMFGYGTGDVDMWGIGWRLASNDSCTYYEPCYHPLAQAVTAQDVENYAWPDIDWLSVTHIAADIREFNQKEPKAIVFSAGSFLEIAWCMRGLERFFMDMVEYPEIVNALLRKVTELLTQITMRAIEEAQGEIDIIWSAGDVGMQTGMMFSPVLWREQVKPFHRQLVEPYKKMGLKTRYHTDGAIVPIIGDLIEMGVDLLDTIQPNTPGMDPENLMSLFGGQISFYGGVDTQGLLPHGTAREVEEKVLHLIRVLGEQGGYVVAASNAVQPDVPIENVLALYRTAREYRY